MGCRPENRVQLHPITAEDIDQVRRSTQIGQQITIRTYKVSDSSIVKRAAGVLRRATVIAKYRHFAVVRLPGGVKDSVLWVDLVRSVR